MSVDELRYLEEEFQQKISLINEYMRPNLHKSERIRLNAWIKKLCSVVDNVFWRRSRNYYAQILCKMVMSNEIGYPFNKVPPDESLPKLNPYDIPFSIRQQISKNKITNENKQNLQYLSNRVPVERNYKNQRKASYQQKVLESLSEDRNEGRSERKRKKELSMFEIIKQSLSYLAQNYETFHDSKEYKEVIEQIIEYGDLMGCDLRNMQISMIQN